MEQKWYTTREQGIELVRKGANPATADMCYEKVLKSLGLEWEWKEFMGKNPAVENNLFSYTHGFVSPCWSMGALLDMMPKHIEAEGKTYELQIRPAEGNLVAYTDLEYGDYCYIKKDSLFDSVYDMVCWLIEGRIVK